MECQTRTTLAHIGAFARLTMNQCSMSRSHPHAGNRHACPNLFIVSCHGNSPSSHLATSFMNLVAFEAKMALCYMS